MDILLYKDGHLAISESPLQGKENNLDDVVMLVTNPQDGDTLVYNATAGKWVNGEGGSDFDPDITNPQDGDTLVYDATAQKWVNGAGGSGGGGGMMLLTMTATETGGTLDATYAEAKAAMQAGTLVGFYMPYDGATSLVLAVSYQDGASHGDPYTVYFKNLDSGMDITVTADTEDGQLYMSNGG